MPGEIEAEAVGLLCRQCREHGLEVAERPGGEVVALGRVDVEVVEGCEVRAGAVRDLHALLRGLLDVASPELVHPPQDVVLGLACKGIWKLNCGWPAAKPPSVA